MTSSQVRTAWNATVFQNATIQAFTTNCFVYDVTSVIKSGFEMDQLYFNQQINFFKLTVNRESRSAEIRGTAGGSSRYEYDVEVMYYLERDVGQSDDNYNVAIDTIETLDSLVISQLGKTWSGTVDYWEMSGILKPQLLQIDERDVWACGYSYRAIEQI